MLAAVSRKQNHFRLRTLVAKFHLSFKLKMEARLKVTPVSSLIDEKNVISLTGLDKQQAVTLYAQLRGDDQTLFHSSAHYIANEAGCVFVNEQPSLGGSYTGLHPMGLLWGLELGPNGRKGFRLFKRDVTTPYEVRLKALQGHLSKDECIHTSKESDNLLAECKFHKWYMSPDVQRIPVRDGRIRGTLFLPPGHGPFPGVIEMLGTAGGLYEYKASLLASRGFAALALAYFKYDDLPKTIDDLDIEYFEEAVEWLCEHPKVRPGGVGIHAISKGAEIAFSLASVCDKVSAVVAIGSPSGFVVVSLSYRWRILKCISHDTTFEICDDNKVHCFRDCFNDLSEELLFPVENINGELLLVVGEDDQVFNSVIHRDAMVERCAKHDKHINVLSYQDAGHLMEPPYTPPCSMSYHTALGTYTLWGGKTVEHAYAQEDYWENAIKFLKANVPSQKSKL